MYPLLLVGDSHTTLAPKYSSIIQVEIDTFHRECKQYIASADYLVSRYLTHNNYHIQLQINITQFRTVMYHIIHIMSIHIPIFMSMSTKNISPHVFNRIRYPPW